MSVKENVLHILGISDDSKNDEEYWNRNIIILLHDNLSNISLSHHLLQSPSLNISRTTGTQGVYIGKKYEESIASLLFYSVLANYLKLLECATYKFAWLT